MGTEGVWLCEEGTKMTEHLSEEEMIAVLFGEKDEQVEAHLRQCPQCRAALLDLYKWHVRLGTAFYRLHCPEPAELAGYLEETLPPAAAENVRRHVQHCATCQREVQALQPFIAAPAQRREEGWLAALATSVRRVFRAYPVPSLVPQPARGARQIMRHYHTQEIDILFSVLASPGGKTLVVVGQLVPPDDKVITEFKGEIAWQTGTGEARYFQVDENGGFLVTDILPGLQHLRIDLEPDRSVVVDLNLDT